LVASLKGEKGRDRRRHGYAQEGKRKTMCSRKERKGGETNFLRHRRASAGKGKENGEQDVAEKERGGGEKTNSSIGNAARYAQKEKLNNNN